MGGEASRQINYGDKLDNDITVTWSKLDCPYPARDGHVACGFENKLFVFGGLAKIGQIETTETNDLLSLDLETKQWSLLSVGGDVPAPRVGATMQQIDGKLYLFGGLSHETGWFNDLHVYDIGKNTWSQVSTTGVPPNGRDKLSSAVVGKKMYIFGGFGPQGTEEIEEDVDEDYSDEEDVPEDQEAAQFGWFNDMHILDTETNSWSSPMYMNLGVPSKRAAAGMTAVDKYLVIFGGRDSEGRKNDLFVYNTETRKWETDLKVSGCQPEPRSFHTVTTVGPRVVVIGGRGTAEQHFNDLHVFDTASQQWLQPSHQGEQLTARGVHTCTIVGEHLVVFGGTSEFSQETMQCQKYHSDTFMFNTNDILTGGALSDPENKENTSNPNIPGVPVDKLQKPVQNAGEPAEVSRMEQH